LALVIDTRASSNLAIKHKNRTTIYLPLSSFQQYDAVVLAPPLRNFHTLQFKNPGSRSGVPNLSLTMYPFSIPKDEHVSLQHFNR